MTPRISLPQMAFLVDLDLGEQSEGGISRARHLVHLFQSHNLRAAWTVADAAQAALLDERAEFDANQLLALKSTSSETRQSGLLEHLKSAAAATDRGVQVVFGQLKSAHASISALAAAGVTAVVRPAPDSGQTGRRRLVNGLWSLQPSAVVPRRRLWVLNSLRGCRANDLVGLGPEANLVVIDAAALGRTGARGLRQFESLLREISAAAFREELKLISVPEIAADLTLRCEIKPQRSILRPAA